MNERRGGGSVTGRRGSLAGQHGFTYVEVLVASLLMAVVLLSLCAAFTAGYANVSSAGKATVALSAARQLLEDLRLLPFEALPNIDGFDTDDPSTLPAADPERELARRWRYGLAGDGPGWAFTSDELTRWTAAQADGAELGAAGTVTVTAQSATLAEVRIRVTVPGRWSAIELTTLVARP
jgi:Tfp pilus assembly protein PilV